MYSISDKKSAIKELQHYLDKIYGDEMTVNQNGIFDDNTIAAIVRFRKDNSLKAEGRMDFSTFILIYNAYLDKIDSEIASKIMPDITFPLKRGDQSASILRFNSMLREILEYYSIYSYAPHSDYFSSDTAEGIKMLQKIFDLKGNDTVDELLYLRMVNEWKSINKIKQG